MLAVTKSVAAALAKRCDAWHLRLDKLCFEQDGGPDAKTRALQDVRRTYAGQTGALQAVAKARLQWLLLLARQHGARFGSVELVADSRLLLHLGRANVLENVGLYADRTTGLLLIPGTALKGLVSTWACWANHFNASDGSFREFDRESTQRRNFRADEASLAKRILGDDSTTGSEHSGEVIFIGGFPVTPPALGLDIVNPHHESNGRVKTRLTPSTFLCVEPGTRWRFAFFVRPGVGDAKQLIETTSRWIREALTQVGIGAKTAAGYGRFREPTEADREAEAKLAEQQKAAETLAVENERKAAEKARQQAAASVALASDYPNPATFKSRVTDRLNPGQLDQLSGEIQVLQKPENEPQREQLKKLLATRDYKDIRKRLREKDWFPKEWLPPQ
jgi:CRISPR-associated protein Cmr6